MTIQVKIAAKTIQLNTTYVVLKEGQTFQINATALPKESNQLISYKVSDTKVATVSGKGVITAGSIGNTSVIVSNEEATNSITVIVNKTGIGESKDGEEIKDNTTNLTSQEQYIVEQINSEKTIKVSAKDYPIISAIILRELHQKQGKLVIEDEKYNLIIDGKYIVNYENQLETNVNLKNSSVGLEIIINNKNQLPGAVELVRKKEKKYKYLYLLHETKGTYERIEYTDTKPLLIDVEGVYVLSDKTLGGFQFKKVYFYVVGMVVVGLIGTYIYVKKKQWFW